MAATTLDGALDPLPGRLDDLAEGVAGQVGQLLALEVGPQRLNWVEVGRIGRQPLHHQPVPLGGQEGAHRSAAVSGEPVPHQRGLLSAKDRAQLLEHPDQRGGVVAAGLDVEGNGGAAATDAVAAAIRAKDGR